MIGWEATPGRPLAAALIAGLALALLSAPARAADPGPDERAEGRRHFDLGEQHFRRGEFPEAAAEYEAGYNLTRLPGFLINIAHCHRLSGDLRRARALYRKYLLVAPTSPRKAEVDEIIARLDQAIAAEGTEAAKPDAPRKPRTPSVRWWLWSAVAASVVGSTVATMALAASEQNLSAR